MRLLAHILADHDTEEGTVFLFFSVIIQCKIPDHGMVLFTFRVIFPTSVSVLEISSQT